MQQEPTQKQPVIVAGKDVKEVDNDYFLIPVKIMDHEGPFSANFPIENRLLPQGKSDACLQLYALLTHQQHTSAAAQGSVTLWAVAALSRGMLLVHTSSCCFGCIGLGICGKATLCSRPQQLVLQVCLHLNPAML